MGLRHVLERDLVQVREVAMGEAAEEEERQTRREKKEGVAGPGRVSAGPQSTSCVELRCTKFHRPNTSARGTDHSKEVRR